MIDTDNIRGAVIPGDPNTAVVRFLCDEVDRLRAVADAAKKYVDEVEGRSIWGTDPYPALRDAVDALDAK